MSEKEEKEPKPKDTSVASGTPPALSIPALNLGSETLSPAGPRVTQAVVAVPCYLAPAVILESPGFTGQFAMTHQALLATVTVQALQALEALKNSFSQPSNPSPLQQKPLQTFDCSVSIQEDSKTQSTPLIVKTSSNDGYNWRKYGQKQVKSSDRSRSYYRCTNSDCIAKKKVERCPDGRETEIVYRGQHNHGPPQKIRCSKDSGSQSSGPIGESKAADGPSNEVSELDPSIPMTEQNSGDGTSEPLQLYCSSDCEGDATVKTKEEHDDEPDPKRRLIESTTPYSEPVLKTIEEPKVVVQSADDAARASDGYKWRKYGQKIVKGNPNPRSYYRCTHNGCPVRKHVEKASDDEKSILVTYEGKHNHDHPAYKSGNAAHKSGNDQPTSCPSDNKKQTDGELAGDDDKASKLRGEKALSAGTLLTMGLNSSSGEEDVTGANSNAVNRRPLFNENCSAVSVHNS